MGMQISPFQSQKLRNCHCTFSSLSHVQTWQLSSDRSCEAGSAYVVQTANEQSFFLVVSGVEVSTFFLLQGKDFFFPVRRQLPCLWHFEASSSVFLQPH